MSLQHGKAYFVQNRCSKVKFNSFFIIGEIRHFRHFCNALLGVTCFNQIMVNWDSCILRQSESELVKVKFASPVRQISRPIMMNIGPKKP